LHERHLPDVYGCSLLLVNTLWRALLLLLVHSNCAGWLAPKHLLEEPVAVVRHVVRLLQSTVDLGLASNLDLVQGLKLGRDLPRLNADLAPSILANSLHSLEVFLLDCIDGYILGQSRHARSIRNLSNYLVLSQELAWTHYCQLDCAYRLQTLHANEVACELFSHTWALC